jgi:hypothetical protein
VGLDRWDLVGGTWLVGLIYLVGGTWSMGLNFELKNICLKIVFESESLDASGKTHCAGK